jgi:hypothetical protein
MIDEMKEWNNVILYVIALIVLMVVVHLYYGLKKDDLTREVSSYCEKKIISELWDDITWYNAILSYDEIYWSVVSNWKVREFTCSIDVKGDVRIYWNDDFPLEPGPIFYSESIPFDFESEEWRIHACEERAWYYLNFNEWSFTWNDENLSWDDYVRTGHATYLKWDEHAEDDVICSINKNDERVEVDFFNHMYNWVLQDDEEDALLKD